MKKYSVLFCVFMGGVVIASEPEDKLENSPVISSLEIGMMMHEINSTAIKENVISVSTTVAEIKAEKELMRKAEQERLDEKDKASWEEYQTLRWMQ